ncbi:hypothetical protein SELMODRAFT_431975 [Selaginella moellendorffii]|uniref:Uncharacterized protein n=1 Tax=Selaginella moellendorffii TaxID=88036 RepID=D8TEJ7_SELML|nr:hypothetical protein SELMODRAFT_431975 [Selaginella moellendorffii]
MKRTKVKKLLSIANIQRTGKALEELIYNISKSKIYLKYCPGALIYTADVLQNLLTRGKKLRMYELEFYCPCTHERELCLWYLELMEQMPTSNFKLDLYLECHPDVAESSHQSFRRTKTFFPSLPTLQTTTWKSSPLQLCINRLVHPLSPTASVGEVAILIGITCSF